MLLNEFKNQYLDLLLSFLWKQWSSLGVAGYVDKEDEWIIDPEALLLLSFSIARYDARLFDEILDWMNVNGKFINIQRFKNILKKYPFISRTVLCAVADKMANIEPRRKNKWQQLAKLYPNNTNEILFFAKNGTALPVGKNVDIEFQKHGFHRNNLELRHYSSLFKSGKAVSLILKSRALFGLNARAEVISYLADGKTAHPSKISKDIFYYQKTVQDALVDMKISEAIYCSIQGREKNIACYKINGQNCLELKMNFLSGLIGRPCSLRWKKYSLKFQIYWIRTIRHFF